MLILLLLLVLSACGGGGPIQVEAKPTSGNPPLSVEFGLKAGSAAQNLLCQLDAEGDGVYEQKAESCTAEDRLSHTYTQAGNYKAKIRVTDARGNGTIFTVEIRVQGPPKIGALSATPTRGKAPLQTQFTWQISDPNQDFLTCTLDVDGDGTGDYTLPNCSSATTQTHTYSTPGAFGAKLSVSDGKEEANNKVAVVAEGSVCTSTPALSGPLQSVAQPIRPKAERLGTLLKLQGLGSAQAAAVPGELLVLGGFSATQNSLGARVLAMRFVDKQWSLVRVDPGNELLVAQRLLAAGARYAQPNYRYKTLAVPTDPLYYLQRPQLNALMGLECAWDIEQGKSAPVRIAVLDDGADVGHPELKNRLLLPAGVMLDVANKDADPSHGNTLGHGSLVAGVLGGEAGNSEGIVGANWGAQIVPIKIFSDADQSSTALVIQGLALARSPSVDAQVINLSLCLVDESNPQLCATQTDAALEAALQGARSEGRIVVASAGNDGQAQVAYPAASPSAIAVGAVQNNKARASFSSYGTALDLVAPGVALLSTNPAHRQDGSSGPYIQVQGTSFSTPLVAASVGLYMSRYKSLKGQWPTPERVYTCLTVTAEDLGNPGPDEQFGSGLVRVDRMLTGAASQTHCFP